MKDAAALRYSKALLLLKGTPGDHEKRDVQLNEVMDFLEKQPELKELLISPQVAKQDKEKLLNACFKGKVEPIIMDFLMILVEKRRLPEFSLIIEEYHKKVKKLLGVKEATIITAVPLDEETTKQFKDKLEMSYQKKVEISNKIDPSIIGGTILIIGNQMIDFSIKERLERLKENLLAVPVVKEKK